MFKALVGIAFCLGMVNAAPVKAERYVRYHSEGKYNPEARAELNNYYIFFVDVDSITKIGEYTLFKQTAEIYKLEADGSTQLTEDKERVYVNAANCSKGMLSRLGLPNPTWDYRQSNGEWWHKSEVLKGYRSDNWVLQRMAKAGDVMKENLFRMVCA